MSSTGSNRRDHYRVQYAMRDRPTFRGEGVDCRVIDCSERGLHLTLPGEGSCLVGAQLEGTVRFRRGTEVFVTGQVVWEYRVERGVMLDPPGIPLKVILDEQRWLRERGVLP
ncbi:MAG: PilZ domain-containing protein [Gemmatimonadaceae bacterium]